MTPLLRSLLLLAFASCPAALLACDADDDPAALAPPGFDPAWTPYVRLDAPNARADQLPLELPLYDPSGLTFDPQPHPDDGLPSLLAAEAKAWRVRRYPVLSLDPPQLGAPSVAITATPGVPGAAVLPMRFDRSRPEDTFGRILESDADGTRLVSDLSGDLWLLHPSLAAPLRLGAGPRGLPPGSGVDLRTADLTSLSAATIAPATDDAPRALLLAFARQLFAVDLDALIAGRRVALEHVAGSGASGALLGGAAARTAPLHLGKNAALTDDGQGNLLILEVAAARLLWLPAWRRPDATLQIVAGGGRSVLYTEVDPREAFLTLTPTARPLVAVDGREATVTLPLSGIPFRVTFAWDATLQITRRDHLTFLPVEQFELGAWTTIGGRLVYADRDSARLLTGPDPALALTGPPPEGPPLPTDALRPAQTLIYSARGQAEDVLLVGDAANASVYPSFDTSPVVEPLPYRPFDTTFSIPRTFAFAPGTEQLLEQLLTASSLRIDTRLVQEDATGSRLGAAGSGPLEGDLQRLAALHPGGAPLLATGWPRDNDDLLLFEPSARTLFARVAGDEDALLEQIAGGYSRPALPDPEPIGRHTLDLKDLHTLDAQGGVALVTLTTARRGDLLIALSGRPEQPLLAGYDLQRDRATLIAGGGAEPPRSGRLGAAVGLGGLSGAVLYRGRAFFVTGEVSGAAALWTLDDTQRLDRLALAGLTPAAPATLWRLGCPDADALLIQGADGAAWLLNPLEAPLEVMGTTLAPGEALPWALDPLIGAGCKGEAPFTVTRSPEGEVLLNGSEPLPADTAAAVGQGDALILSRTLPRPALWERRPDGELIQRSSLGAPPLHGRSISKADLADDLPAFGGVPGGPLWCAAPGALLRLVPNPDYSRSTPLEVLWSGPPLRDDAAPRALAPTWDGAALYVATDELLYRYDIPALGTGDADGANVGAWRRVAGGGQRSATPGTRALDADLQAIHAVTVDKRGRVWLRWDRYLGYLDDHGRLIAIAGGGDKAPHDARFGWEVQLTSTDAFQSPLAVTPRGHAILAEPLRGVVLGMRPR